MKRFLTILVLAIALLGATYLVKPQLLRAPNHEAEVSQSVVEKDYVKYYGVEGKNAFVLLQATTAVEFKQYDFGVFVQSINGLKPDDKHFWKFYVNGQESQVGADTVQAHNGDILEWRLAEITNSN